ncbi:SPFH domain-containing protein [Ghiorsea bivora]|uniref:SPFH domain-containing protein n=1 Tax=Ghiorsea bivora TaxID=1485545 RepID=UPI00056DBB47|nr:SPFH domain-containing protein [Ghiorsea bivora]
MLDTGLMLTLFLAAVVIAFIFKGIVVIRSSERMVIERFGNYVHTLEPGINFIIPFVDRPREFIWKKAPSDNALSRLLGESSDGHLAATARIDIRETVLDMPSQTVFTKDNVSVHINALLYIEITKPHDAVYRISNLPNAIEKLTQTTLRSLVGEMELDKTLSSREQINSRLQLILDEAADDWGAKVKRVEIQDLEVPGEIQAAMEKQMRAERDKRASILEAEGMRKSAILKAEGEKASAVLVAEGNRTARILEADGEKEALNKLKETLGDEFSQYLLAVRYLETMNHIGAQTEGDKTIFMPMDATATLGAIGGIQELFKGKS